MIVVNSRADLPAPPPPAYPGARNWTYFIRSSLAPNVVVEAWDGEAYQLAKGDWPDDGYYVTVDVATGKAEWRIGVHKFTGDVKSSRRRAA